jgi:hypothetical protein
MKKAIFFLFFLSIFLVPAFADYTVDSVTVTAQVAANGKTEVSTIIQLTFDTTTDQVTVPLPETDVSRVSVGDFKSQVQDTEDGVDVVIQRSGGFVGTQTFSISYVVPHDQTITDTGFTLGLLSSRWQRTVGECSFQVVLPKVFDTAPVLTSGYYGELSQSDTNLVTTDLSLSGSIQDRMAYDSLTVDLELPEDYFTVRTATVPGISMTYLALGMLGIWALCILYWRLKIRSGRTASTPRLLPPEGILPCQLPMVLDGRTCDVTAMVLEWANLGYLTIGVSRRGVVTLTRRMDMGSERSRPEQWLFARIFKKKRRVAATPGRFSGSAAKFRAASRKGLYPVILDSRGGNPALVQVPCQVLLSLGIGYLFYQALPEGGGFVVLAILGGLCSLVYSNLLHESLAAYGGLRKLRYRNIALWVLALALLGVSLFVGALPEVLTGLCACVFSGFATAPGPRRSSRGLDALAQTKGCRTFYRRASWQRLQLYQGKNSRFFQNQLPRAVALGVEEPFAKRFETINIPTPDWLELTQSPAGSAQALQKQLRPILRQLRAAFR